MARPSGPSRAMLASGRPKVGGPLRDKENRPSTKGVYLQSLKYAFGIIWSVRPGYIVLNILNLLWTIPERIIDIFIIQFVVNTAVISKDMIAILWGLAGYAAFSLARIGFKSLVERDYNVEAEDRIRSDIQLRLHEQARTIELAAFDTKQFYDDFARALDVLDERVIKCYKDLMGVAQCILSVITISAVIATMSPPLIAIVAACSLIGIFALNIRSRMMALRNKAIAPIMRRFQYLNDLYYERRFAKDMRMENLDDVARADHKRCTEELSNEDRKWGRKSAFWNFIGFTGTPIADVSIFTYLAWGIIFGGLEAGTVMALYSAAWQFSSNFINLSMALPELGETCLLIADVRGFENYVQKNESRNRTMSLDSGVDESPAEKMIEPGNLELKNVTFGYDPSNPVLKDITLNVQSGKTLAIVGHNGAGKSTIAKLLLGLYEPNEGCILLDGKPYSDIDRDQLRAAIAAVHQDYQYYAYSVAENVLMRPVKTDDDLAKVRWALEKVGLLAKVDSFPESVHAHVTKEFSDSGELFSGGEIQRLALARALAKDAPIVVLDEPSSALDPIAEREMIDLMEELFSHKICVTISHRLSMTRDSDEILVLDAGRVVERGKHDDLISLHGVYAEMWDAQAGKYVESR